MPIILIGSISLAIDSGGGLNGRAKGEKDNPSVDHHV